jgi:hypothetical protein
VEASGLHAIWLRPGPHPPAHCNGTSECICNDPPLSKVHAHPVLSYGCDPAAVLNLGVIHAGQKPNILISGAGVAGPILAYWLTHDGFSSTVIERAPALRTGGHPVDLWLRGRGSSGGKPLG